jgi:hypothetical protein
MFSTKRNNPESPRIPPSRVCGPKKFSTLINSTNNTTILSPKNPNLDISVAISPHSSDSSACSVPFYPKTVATLDIIAPESKQRAKTYSQPRNKPIIKPTATNSPGSMSFSGRSVNRPKPKKQADIIELENELIAQSKLLHKLQVDMEQVFYDP